ncbi:GATA-type zinc finger protein 1 [Vanacampus margaritifer]
MSTGQSSQVTLFQKHQRAAEQNESQSALLYLFREVSKLDASLQSGVLATRSLSSWVQDSSAGNGERAPNSINPNVISLNKHLMGNGKVEIVVESPPGGHSPWLALSLINQQCKRLMDLGEEEADSGLLFPTMCDVPSAHTSGTGASVDCTLRPPPVAGISTSVVPVVDEQRNCFSSKPKTCEKELTCHGPPQMAEKDTPALSVDMFEGSHDSSSDTHVSRSSSSVFTRDHNANLILGCHSPSKPDDHTVSPKSHCANVPIEHATLSSHLRSKGGNEPPGIKHSWRTRTPRKQPNPSRSGDIHDPDFQGVTFRMRADLNASRDQCRLSITSKYSKELSRNLRKRGAKTRRSRMTSSSDEGSVPTASDKQCAHDITFADRGREIRTRIQSENYWSEACRSSHYKQLWGQSLCIMLHQKDPDVERCRRWDPSLQCLWHQVQEVQGPLCQLLAHPQKTRQL